MILIHSSSGAAIVSFDVESLINSEVEFWVFVLSVSRSEDEGAFNLSIAMFHVLGQPSVGPSPSLSCFFVFPITNAKTSHGLTYVVDFVTGTVVPVDAAVFKGVFFAFVFGTEDALELSARCEVSLNSRFVKGAFELVRDTTW